MLERYLKSRPLMVLNIMYIVFFYILNLCLQDGKYDVDFARIHATHRSVFAFILLLFQCFHLTDNKDCFILKSLHPDLTCKGAER